MKWKYYCCCLLVPRRKAETIRVSADCCVKLWRCFVAKLVDGDRLDASRRRPRIFEVVVTDVEILEH